MTPYITLILVLEHKVVAKVFDLKPLVCLRYYPKSDCHPKKHVNRSVPSYFTHMECMRCIAISARTCITKYLPQQADQTLRQNAPLVEAAQAPDHDQMPESNHCCCSVLETVTLWMTDGLCSPLACERSHRWHARAVLEAKRCGHSTSAP